MDGKRIDGRAPDQLRTVSIQAGESIHAEGSALISFGHTRVLCLASVEERVPAFLIDADQGWITAEYAMLPRATHTRGRRERQGPSGRTLEIQRLIARSLRAAVDLEAMPGYTITVDCDVLQADGGTRCASITGAFVALHQALRWMSARGLLDRVPVRHPVAAVSVGMLAGVPVLDLCYQEDSAADVDMNVVMTGVGQFVEIQGTAEHHPFSDDQLHRMLGLARKGLDEIFRIQAEALAVSESGPEQPVTTA